MSLSRIITRPFWLVVLPACVSFVVWLVPWGEGTRRGFDVKEPLTINGVVTLVAWYGSIGLVATLAWLAGRQTSPNATLDDTDDDRVYRIITGISAVGVLGMYAMVTASSPGLMTDAFQSQQLNLVKEAVPNTPGLSTLRYASILGGAIALHRLVILRQPGRLHLLNLVLLGMNVLVASRLALIMTLVLFAGLWAVRRPGPEARTRRVSKVRVTVLVIVALGLLVEANYLRNANYYRTFYGVTSPIAMAAGEAVTYVGTPTQVAISVGRDTTVKPDASDLVGGVERQIVPSFFTSVESAAQSNAGWYRGTVSVDNGLTTNSALVQMYGQLGLIPSFILMLVVASVAGWLMGHFSRYRSYMALGAFVAGYCFVELWRTYLFAEGIVWFLVLTLGFACWQGRPRVSTASRRTRSSV